MPTAREVASRSLAHVARRYPHLHRIPLDTSELDPRESRLALAIHRTALQRWITLEFLLDRFLKKPFSRLDPELSGVLAGAAAQLLCMDRLPRYAVVDESVSLVRGLVGRGAARMANAVLRRLADLVGQVEPDLPWISASNCIPLDAGTRVLTDPVLPEPDDWSAHLSIATSCPRQLVNRWIEAFGERPAALLCQHGVENPPTFVAEGDRCVVWEGNRESLVDYLRQDRRRRVQDPTSGLPVVATRDLMIRSALDFCAGQGTKTRQLAELHPQARIVATDVDQRRREGLQEITIIFANVAVVKPDEVPGQGVDLLLLDVPCTNTGVLPRRPEARYRFGAQSLTDLVDLQRQIMTELLGCLRPGGYLLYSTCSLESEENEQQRDWLIATTGAAVVCEQLTLPAGRGQDYHDGGYFVLAQVP